MQDCVRISSASSITNEEARQHSLRDRVFKGLVDAGQAGLTNLQLLLIGGIRFGGRVHELRQPEHGGHVITVHPGKTRRIFIYTLQPAAGKPPSKRENSLPLFRDIGSFEVGR